MPSQFKYELAQFINKKMGKVQLSTAERQEILQTYSNLLLPEDSAFIIANLKMNKVLFAGGNLKGILGHTAQDLVETDIFNADKVPPASLFDVIILFEQMMKFVSTICVNLNMNFSVVNFPYYKKNKEIARLLTEVKFLAIVDGIPEIAIIFGRLINHLVKNDNFWMRIEQEGATYCYNTNLQQKMHTDILTPKEKEIVTYVFKGTDYNTIAQTLNISHSTVVTHIKNAIKKTGAKDATALIHLCHLAKVFE